MMNRLLTTSMLTMAIAMANAVPVQTLALDAGETAAIDPVNTESIETIAAFSAIKTLDVNQVKTDFFDVSDVTEVANKVIAQREEEARKAAEEEAARQAAEEAARQAAAVASTNLYSASSFKSAGAINWNGYRWTWYSERVLPGGGLSIPGRHNDENGYICDSDGYICLASNDLSKGTVVETPFGKKGKVYDSGCASGTLDVYVGW